MNNKTIIPLEKCRIHVADRVAIKVGTMTNFKLSKRLFQLFLFAFGVSVGALSILSLRSFSFDNIPSLPFFSVASAFSNSSSTPLQPAPPPPPPAVVGKMHNMSDDELLARAAIVDGNSSSTYKVAFMFLTPGRLPLAPVWERFFKGHKGLFSVYVHPHPSYNESDVSLDSAFYDSRIPSQPVYWGTISMIDAERRLLANALLDPSNQRFVLLSDSCIPVFNFTTVYNYLKGTNQSFLGSFDDPRKPGRGRYNHRMWPNITIEQWRKGSQWFEVHRDLAVNIVSDKKYYPLFSEFCHPQCYNDEHYLPTLVNILYPELNSNRTVTWVDWSRGGPHPRKFGWIDVKPDLLNWIRFGYECPYNGNTTNICHLFARKFLPNTVGPLLKVATWLLGFDP